VTDPDRPDLEIVKAPAPPSFLPPKLRPRVTLNQLALCDEPDHDPEHSQRARYRSARSSGRESFADAVRRRREARELTEYELARDAFYARIRG
jgi:hypothetical protein